MRRVSGGFLVWTILLLGLISVASSEIYKWVDRQGQVHFADNLSAIPPEYRQQVEERASAPPSRPSGPGLSRSAPAPLPAVAVPQTRTRHIVPLHRAGNAWLADVVFNGTLTLRMIVDTGASWTLLPTSAAKQLALNVEDAPVTFIQGVTGRTPALVPLTKVQSVTAGGATVHDVEVIVYDSAPLLGMPFLDEFLVTIDPIAGRMTLTPLANLGGKTLYGGRPEVWWRRKLRHLHRRIEDLEAYLSQRQSAHAALSIRNPSPSKLTKLLQYYQEELATLEHKAALASVPRR